ncbi:iron-sulfur assembly protein, putative [Plasmodium reichenowi]|uniref:Iron-sulfur assembly protein, putative n=1 Tax=Plasmodium reichenowi TaxID=5854 RepID=A0A060RSZ3_PLARE|nr:iron-sulfur assembly protein, putative [Plasmodium reichenowi]
MFNNFSNMYLCTLAEKLCKFKKNKFNNIHRNSNLYNITWRKLHFIQTISNNNFNSEIIKKYGDVINKIKFIHTEKRNKQERFMFNNKKYIKRKEYILNDLNEFISIIPNPEINNEITNNSNQKKNEDNKQNILSTNQQIITKYNLNHKENVTSNLNFNNKEEDEKKLDKLLKKRNIKKRDIVTITEEAREELKKIISINKKKNNNNYNDMNNTICNDKNILKLFFITKGCNGLTHSFNFISKKDIHKEDEIIYDDQNNILLVIDKNCILYVINTTLDYYKDDLTEKFIFKNPNITSICPCGTSFHFSKKKIIK